MRRPVVAGNWKMNKTLNDAGDLARGVREGLSGVAAVECVLCPPYTALGRVREEIRRSDILLGAQDVYWEAEGAFTGEISAGMLRDFGCTYVIVGHSERRTLFHETDENVRRKVGAALAAGLRPIVCVGETLEQRESGRTEQVVGDQVRSGLADLGDAWRDVVVAYEPVWAIGTGKTATTEQAQQVHAFIRGLIGEMAGGALAGEVRIQYGGSVKPSNAEELFHQPDIDGGLIGGASLDAPSFAAIVRAAAKFD